MFKFKRLVTYVLNGGITTLSQFSTLFVLVEFLQVKPLLASVVSFIVSLCVGFTLHRFITFSIKEQEGMATQFVLVASMAVANLGINTTAMYALLNLGVHYLVAQFFVTGIIVIWTYIGYNYIFKLKRNSF